jgi:rfaE bifunctional protein nucleotidyltransferase chain/domain
MKKVVDFPVTLFSSRIMAYRKIKSIPQMKKILGSLKKQGKKIVFTNGCFDILHVGHIRYLTQARKLGDRLVVGLNTDRSVRTIKGEKRPIVSEIERAEVLSALEVVDYVVLFDEPDPLHLITALKPTILVKGADWSKDKIIGRGVVEQSGGKVVRIPLVPGASSTGVIEKIIDVYGKS